jgi:excinuclease ABC subunit C
MVVFQDGEPLKEDYRHFNIRSVKGIDDFAMMGEIIRRRYTKMLQEGWNFPDLILIDGGKGQLSAAQSVLAELNVAGPTLVSLAKREEELFLPGREGSIRLAKDASALHLVQQVRDEAHRFAITHHRKRLRKKLMASVVAQVPGVGPRRTQALLTHVGGLDNLTHASVEVLMKVPGINPAIARKIHAYFHPENTSMKTVSGTVFRE